MNSKSRLLVLLLIVSTIGVAAWGSHEARSHRSWIVLGPQALRSAFEDPQVGSRVARTALRSLTGIARCGTTRLEAQEALDFKPVPAESLSEFERRRARAEARRAAASSEPPVVDIAEPSPPDEPAIPASPGKSGNITRLGSDIQIEEDQVVVGDVVALGGDVTVAGHVEGDVAAMGGDVFLKSTARIDGDVVCMGGRLTEEDGAKVGGQRVSGLGAKEEGAPPPPREPRRERHNGGPSGSFVGLLIMLALAWAYTGLGPGRTAAAAETLRLGPGTSLGVGALIFALIIPSIVALALVVAILCITIIGIPFALAALLAYVLFLALVWSWGLVVSAVVIGDVALGRLAARSAAGPAGAGVMERPAPTLMRKALVGMLVLGGFDLIGEILKIGPLHGIGVLISVLSFIAGLVALTIGAGAWVRTEIKAGTLARWWRGNQWGRNTPAAAPAGGSAPFAPVPYVPPPPPSYVPPPPPSPPSAFAPPNEPGDPPPSAPVS